MGKKGDMLRWMKAQKSTYTFTRAQLEEHDRQVAADAVNRKKQELKDYAHQVIGEDFAERMKLLEGPAEDVVTKVFCLCVSAPVRVLVRDFGWTPIGDDHRSNSRMKLSRFSSAVLHELEQLVSDELMDIRRYSKQVYEETGVYFEMDDEEE